MPDTSFPITTAEIVGLCLESIFYGMFLVSFFPCIRALLWDSDFKLRKQIHWIMVVVAFLLFAFATLDMSFGLQHAIQAFVLYTGPGGPAAVFENNSNYVQLMRGVCIFFTISIGDAVLVYRCWIVYAKSYLVIIVPLLVWMATTACAMVLIWIEDSFHQHSSLLASKFSPFLRSFISLTIVQNIITTGLIIWQIYKVDRENAKYRYNTGSTNTGHRQSSRLRNVMRIVIESGLLYTGFALISFCTYITGSNAFYPSTDMEIQVIGIAFNLIIIRANAQSQQEYTIQHSGQTSVPLSTLKMASVGSGTTAATGPKPVGIHVTMSQENDSESGMVKHEEAYSREENNF